MGKKDSEIIVIGCGDAGLSAAYAAKRQSPACSVTVVSNEDSYYPRCPLPYLVSGEITEKLDKPLDEIFRASGIKVVKDKALKISDSVECENSELGFDKVIIATGASSVCLPGTVPLRTIEDAEKIKKRCGNSTVVVGAGLMGCELASVLKCTLLEKQQQVLPGFDPRISKAVKKELENQGVKVLTDSSEIPEVGLKISAAGVRPNIKLAQDSNIKCSENGIIVGDNLETSMKNVYAAGDCIEQKSFVTNKPIHARLGPQAERQGFIAGTNASGGKMVYRGVLGAAIAKIASLEIGRTGVSAGLPEMVSSKIKTTTKPEFHPTSKDLFLKLVFSRKQLVGAEAMGGESVAGVIDVASLAIQKKATVDDLINFAYSYAPPMCSAPNPFVLCSQIAKQKYEHGLG